MQAAHITSSGGSAAGPHPLGRSARFLLGHHSFTDTRASTLCRNLWKCRDCEGQACHADAAVLTRQEVLHAWSLQLQVAFGACASLSAKDPMQRTCSFYYGKLLLP